MPLITGSLAAPEVLAKVVQLGEIVASGIADAGDKKARMDAGKLLSMFMAFAGAEVQMALAANEGDTVSKAAVAEHMGKMHVAAHILVGRVLDREGDFMEKLEELRKAAEVAEKSNGAQQST